MKAKILRSLVLFVGLNGALIAAQESRAQPDVPPNQVAQQKYSVTAFKIEHVRVEIMSMWLQGFAKPVAGQKTEEKRGVFSEYPGLESIAANPKTNEIWAVGTPESITKLRDLISFIDRPLRQVEVKTQFVEVDKTEIANLEIINDTDQRMKMFPAQSEAQSEFADKLKALVRSRQAKVIHASQVTTPNNSKAMVSAPANAIAPVVEWSVTPTIQNDNTVTLFFNPKIGSNSSEVSYTTVANVKGGDIMVFSIKNSDDERREMLAILSIQIVED